MGDTFSTLPEVEREKNCWVQSNKLEFDESLRNEQLAAINGFQSPLHLCSTTRLFANNRYEHWFITDGSLFIEFGVDLQPFLVIHNKTDRLKRFVNEHGDGDNEFVIHKDFDLTTEVKNRMAKVCGAKNHSICLRNSEHLARYIFDESWVSFQMSTSGGNIYKLFEKLMVDDVKKVINHMPENLEVVSESDEVVYPECEYFVKFLAASPKLTSYDETSYSVVLLGPTGAGKSRMINVLLNQEKARSEPGVHSITKNVTFYKGTIDKLRFTSPQMANPRMVNLVDTMGLCDSRSTINEVFKWLKDRVQINVGFVDVVVVVCSSRIEKVQADAIKQCLHWLKIKEYPGNFVFVYNKADWLTPRQKTENILHMSELLGVTGTWEMPVLSKASELTVSTRIATKFPPNAPYDFVKEDREKLLDAIFNPRDGRIPLKKDDCC